MSIFGHNNEYLLVLKKLDDLHQEHLLILKKLEVYPRLVSPELEKQVLRAQGLAHSIDMKVPDKGDNVCQ